MPRAPDAPEADGYLMALITRYDGEPRSELIVLDTARFEDGPIATVKMPFRLRGAIHGNWVSAEALASAAAT